METPERFWLALAKPITNSLFHKAFIFHFGLQPLETNELWLLLTEKACLGFDASHLLWTLFFLKTISSSLLVTLPHLHCSKKAFWKWINIGLELICNCLPKVKLLL
jgi:hypothetical protein